MCLEKTMQEFFVFFSQVGVSTGSTTLILQVPEPVEGPLN